MVWGYMYNINSSCVSYMKMKKDKKQEQQIPLAIKTNNSLQRPAQLPDVRPPICFSFSFKIPLKPLLPVRLRNPRSRKGDIGYAKHNKKKLLKQ